MKTVSIVDRLLKNMNNMHELGKQQAFELADFEVLMTDVYKERTKDLAQQAGLTCVSYNKMV